MLQFIIDSLLVSPSTSRSKSDLERAQWLSPQYGIIAALMSLGSIVAAIINTDPGVRIATAIMAVMMAIWAWASFRFQRRH